MLKGLGGLGQIGDMAKMMKAAQEMQDRLAAAQAGLDAITVEGQAGAGLVKVTASARGEIRSVRIDPSIFREEDREMVEDLILAAIRDASARAAEAMAAEMRKATEGLPLPPGMKLPF
ncbi:DNA-binding protein, YbaB/EbfC family [Rubellimicrobium thermophilum DSM 16684]|uniref:Nucleoid-associated protein ruthe_01801 n=1 Tax=Rubellimicrobium thermophilum DSM 16684 TaxID=1123069 RepID=S9SFN3_9RHOB|nr:YbaB/EbfC family nucleoid-associated protein [Rubellimicrobium thermophilum]EPX85074.1 DNA-binding protein, YbaB/EbfC family [Rubellimicrobium thermophilum DSM 16684]